MQSQARLSFAAHRVIGTDRIRGLLTQIHPPLERVLGPVTGG
ncbi:hypothetical protein [Micromonospora sp. MP36]|nr:hypothetical protein [Micromonospora sp. MP36]